MKVRLYIRVRLDNGTRQYVNPVYAANGKLKPFYASVDGKPEHHPEGVYHLRYRKNKKLVWESVGTDAQQAMTLRLRRERFFAAQDAGIEVVVESPEATGHSLSKAIVEYLAEVKADKSRKTHTAYSLTLRQFAECCKKPMLEATERKDILTYKDYLRTRGNVSRTIANHLDFLKIFFNHYGVTWPLLKTDRVKYTEKAISAYSGQENQSLMGAAHQEEADLLQFLLCTGVREQEAMYATWRDVDFTGKTFTVREKLDLGFTPKDKEEGAIPIPDSLVKLLKARRERYPSTRLIFPHPAGSPDGHFLRILKRLAFRAGMNCGECYNKAGKCCSISPTCTRYVLHRFRKTFAALSCRAYSCCTSTDSTQLHI